MFIKFKSFNIKSFFALGSEAISVDFLVILFMLQARISKGILLVSLGASIFIGLIFSLNTSSNQIKLLIFS